MSNDVVYQSKGALIQFIETNMGTVTATSFVGDGALLQNVTGSGGGGGGISWDGSTANGVATFKDADEATVESNLTFDGSTLTVTGDASITGDTTLGNASGDTVTFNAKNITLTNVAAMGGTDNTVLICDGTSVATDEIDSRVWGSTLIDASGTPADNQVGIWTDANTMEGSSNLTFDGTDLTVANDLYLGSEIIHNGDTDTKITFGTNTQIYTCQNNERLRLNSVGVGLMGATPIAGLAVTGDIETSGDLTVNGGDAYSISSTGGYLYLRRNESSITSGETLGSIVFQATENGTDIAHPAQIIAMATETFVEDSNEGTKLQFLTTAEGAALPGVNMTLDGSGNLTIEGALRAAAGENLQLQTSGSMFFDIDEDNNSSSKFYWRNGGNTTVMELDESGDLQMDGDLTVDGGDIVTTDATGGDLFLRRNDSSIVADEILGNIFFQATENGSDISFGAAIKGVATETFIFPSDEGTKLEFWTTANGSGLYDVAMTLSGNKDLQVMGDLRVSGGDITLGAATSYIRDPQGHQRISIAGTGNIVLYDASGGTEFTVANGSCTAAGNLTVSGDLFVNDYARIDALRIGTTSEDPAVDGNLYIEGATTAVGQITPGYDPQLLAQNIFDPSSYALFGITNDEDYLYIVDWDTGATSTTDPKVAFVAPASGKVIVDVQCYIDDTSSSGSGPYIYAAMSSNFGGPGTKISKTDASIVGNGEKRIWYPDESDRGVRNFSFYVSGLTGGDTYTWYLYMRRWNDGDTNRVICGGDYPMFEMSVRPIYSSALIYTT